ncbi:MAG: hypothetical protein JWP97_2081 [Labilithrix sp.]|nr:hypothetical protein [Labilithrix sp.]
MHRISLALGTLVLPAALVSLSALGGTGCDSTLNLGEGDAAVIATPLTCEQACSRLIDTCELGPATQRSVCLGQCASSARLIDLQCIAKTPCLAILATCASGYDASTAPDQPFDAGDPLAPSEIAECQSACDHVLTFSCMTAAEHATCRELCATSPHAKRTSFSSCAFSGGVDCSTEQSCYGVFVGD